MRLKHILAIGILAGIGFTMSIFITLLAFNETSLINSSKVAVLTGSLISAVAGVLVLRSVVSKK
jgi:NhaA family Na+:H+ antiporter